MHRNRRSAVRHGHSLRTRRATALRVETHGEDIMYRLRTICMTLIGLLLVIALPELAPAQSAAPAAIWSHRIDEAPKPIEIAAKRKQRALPKCVLNAGATKACSCPVSGGSSQVCRAGEVCSASGCGG